MAFATSKTFSTIIDRIKVTTFLLFFVVFSKDEIIWRLLSILLMSRRQPFVVWFSSLLVLLLNLNALIHNILSILVRCTMISYIRRRRRRSFKEMAILWWQNWGRLCLLMVLRRQLLLRLLLNKIWWHIRRHCQRLWCCTWNRLFFIRLSTFSCARVHYLLSLLVSFKLRCIGAWRSNRQFVASAAFLCSTSLIEVWATCSSLVSVMGSARRTVHTMSHWLSNYDERSFYLLIQIKHEHFKPVDQSKSVWAISRCEHLHAWRHTKA